MSSVAFWVQLEASLRLIALSAEWLKHPSSGPLLWPASMQAKRSSALEADESGGSATMQFGVQWWRGGQLARRICDWEMLPKIIARRGGRQGLFLMYHYQIAGFIFLHVCGGIWQLKTT
jgi:hypothetical protein